MTTRQSLYAGWAIAALVCLFATLALVGVCLLVASEGLKAL